MKPLQIGLLVLVGALGGALIMKFTQHPKVAAHVAQAVVPPAVPPPAVAPEPAPDLPQPASPKNKPAPVVRMTHHSQPMRRALPPAATVAQNIPPAEPLPPSEPPAPAPMQAEPASANEPAPPTEPSQPAEPPAAQPAPSVTLQAGMTLPVRLGESLSSEYNHAGDTFTATLDAPLTAGGFVIAEKGARVEGRVIEAQKKGKAVLALELTKLVTSDGQHVAIKTAIFRKQAQTMATGDQVGIVAAAAGIGAIIGAMAGGGKGAAIGAGAGGAAGGGGVVATRDKAVSLPTESKLTFRLTAPITLTEQLNN